MTEFQDLHLVPLARARYTTLAGPNGERIYAITTIAPNGDSVQWGLTEAMLTEHRNECDNMLLAGLENDD